MPARHAPAASRSPASRSPAIRSPASRSPAIRSPAIRSPAIRQYGLFGEAGQMPDVLHCETIAARSVLHNWELAPHRHARLHQVLLVREGGGSARLESEVLPLAANTLVNVPCGDVHAFVFTPGTVGWVLSLPDELVADLIDHAPVGRSSLARPAAVSMPKAETKAFAALLEPLCAAFGDQHGAGRNLLLRGLGTAVLGLALQRLYEASVPATEASGRHLMRRFEGLLEQHHASGWQVSDYARKLAVTTTHLTRIARAATGLPASRLIDDRRMREARRYLAYTTASVAAVAEALGFDDPAYFSRVFSRTCGDSPRAFREKISKPAPRG